MDATDLLQAAQWAGLLGGLGYASWSDLKRREVDDELWVVMALLGGALLLASSWGEGGAESALVLVLVLFVLEHFLPWDEHLPDRAWIIVGLEGTFYAAVVALAAWSYLDWAPRPPVAFFAALAAVLIARGLFEVGVLYGGADAKALMASALLVPLGPVPWLVGYPPRVAGTLLTDVPFALTLLIDGAVLTLGIPLVILALNLREGEHRMPRAFYLYKIPTEDLPRRFVWLREPPPEAHDREETTEEDEALRQREADRLLAQGVKEVWVTPQIPFVVALALGAVVGLLAGDLLLWLVALL